MPQKILFGETSPSNSDSTEVQTHRFQQPFLSLLKVKGYLSVIGIIIHELSHYLMCKFLGVEIYKWSLFQANSTEDGICFGYFTYESPNTYTQNLLINIAPLFFNTIIGMILLFALQPAFTISIHNIVSLFVIFTIFTQAFPSMGDVKNINEYSKRVGISHSILIRPLQTIAELQIYFVDYFIVGIFLFVLFT